MENLFAATARLRVPFVEEIDGKEVQGTMSCDIPADATPEMIEKAKASMQAAHDSVRAFHGLPREKQLEYYLQITCDALLKIMDGAKFDVRDYDVTDTEDKDDLLAKYRKQIVDACCTADMAIIQIPRDARTTEVKI